MSFVINKQSPTQSAYWHFRINDISQEQFDLLINLSKQDIIEWMVIGELEKENEKGVHYHVAVKFNRSVRKSYAKTNLLLNQNLALNKDYYLETKYTKASVEQFIDYCIKNGTRYTTLEEEKEEEKPPIKTKLSKLELHKLRIEKARAGDEDWFLENDFDFMLGNKYAKLMLLVQPHKTEILEGDLCNYWIWGQSGTCKSAAIHLLWPDAYSKVVSNSKWDNYSNTDPGHQVVHVEEVDDFDDIKEGLEGLAGLKRMADRYPFPVRFNYGSRNLMIRPKTFVITSNFSPNQILSGGDKYGHVTKGLETQLKAIHRKFKVMHITEFKDKYNIIDKYDITGKLIGCRFADDIESIPTVDELDKLMNEFEFEEKNDY